MYDGKDEKEVEKVLSVSEVIEEELTAENEALIDGFLIKKRKEIVLVLAQKEKMSHGELAKAVDTSIASLSNILARFEKFSLDLIGSKSEGKYRYYYLTGMCRKYLNNRNQTEYEQQNMKVVQYETTQLLQKIKASLAQYIEWCGEDYVLELSEGLIERMYCRNIISNENERVIDDFIINCEKLLLYNYEIYSLEIIELLEDKHLQSWLTKILDKFEGFRPILIRWNQEEDIAQIYKMLESAIEKVYQVKEKHGKLIGLSEQGDELLATVFHIVKNMEACEEKDINDCFMRFMAGNKLLSGFMTHLIVKYDKKKEECI